LLTREYIQARLQVLEGHRQHHLAQANAAIGAAAELKTMLDVLDERQKEDTAANDVQKDVDPGSGVRDEADLPGGGAAEAN
jgi:hypothetical protein